MAYRVEYNHASQKVCVTHVFEESGNVIHDPYLVFNAPEARQLFAAMLKEYMRTKHFREAPKEQPCLE